MKSLLRLLTVILRARARRHPSRGLGDVSRIPLRVWPGDLDLLGHMNNGSYLTIQDLGRIDWMIRTGLEPRFRARGWYAVVVAQTIAYRASLHPGERFVLETRYLGHDVFSFYMEQRFTVDGQIRSQSFVRGRFLGADGPVPVAELIAEAPEIGAMPDRVPPWVREWSEHTRLPSRRSDAPSAWSNTSFEGPDGGASHSAHGTGDEAGAR